MGAKDGNGGGGGGGKATQSPELLNLGDLQGDGEKGRSIQAMR